MTVYVEYVLIDNFVIDFLLLKAALYTAGISASKKRLFLAAAAGAAVALVYPAVVAGNAVLIPLKISAGLLIVLISAKFRRVKEYFICVLLFFAYTALLGGAISGIYSLFGLDSKKELSAALIILPSYLIMKAALKAVRYVYGKKEAAAFTFKAEITVCGVTVASNAFLDTGNNLYDKDKPVVLISASLAKKFFDCGKLFAIKKLPVETVNGKTFLPAFAAEKLVLKAVSEDAKKGTNDETKEERFEYENITLCAAKTGFSAGCEVIIPPSLKGLVRQKEAKTAQSGL